MTGQGRGAHSRDGCSSSVELRTVNRKQAEIQLDLPHELEPLEARVRETIGQVVSRGRCEVRVSVELPEGAVRARLNQSLARAYAAEFSKLAAELKLENAVTLDLLARCPGVIAAREERADAESFWPVLEKALTQALDALTKMREREGSHLAKDLAGRVGTMRKAAARVAKQAPKVQQRFREQLLQRIRAAGLENIPPDDERVLKEVVFFADRSDIAEELARLQSHFAQFDDCLKSTEPVGRKLDFLAQEMNREINTIGSKANDALISGDVVLLKTELERFREQAQNVE